MDFVPHLRPLLDSEAFLGFNAKPDRTPLTIIGVPLDLSSSYRSGSSWAPKHIRSASRSLELCSMSSGVNMEDVGFEDLGDVVTVPGDVTKSLEIIERTVLELLKRKRRLFILGGEHTLTLPAVRAFSKVYPKPCMVVLDAHSDLREEYLGSRYNHATVMRRVAEEGLVRKMIIVGVRAVSLEEAEAMRSASIKEYLEVLMFRGDAERLLREFAESLKDCEGAASYISIDMDVLDPAYAPGVQTPEPMGLEPFTLLRLLSKAVNVLDVHVTDLVEVAPPYDVAEATAFLAAKIIIEVASMVVDKVGAAKTRCW